jgi:hypothetical protein
MLLCSFIDINAQNKPENQKFKTFEAPNITKDNLKIPTLQELLKRSKNKKDTLNSKYLVRCSSDIEMNCSVTEIKKNNTIVNVYEYRNGIIYMIRKLIKDKQKYVRKKIYFNGEESIITQGITSQINFYPDGKIHTIIHYDSENTSCKLGKWYAYSNDGTLSQEIDHNQKFKLNFLDIIQIVDSYEYPFFYIGRGFNDIHSYWYIQLEPYYHDKLTKRRKILLDDQTKEVIYDVSQPDENFLRDKEYDKLNLSKSSLEWLKENDKHQIPDAEFYKEFRK